MTKTTSIVLLCVFTVLVLFCGIFAFILDGQPAGINDYHSAYGLIQKDSMFGDYVQATYKVELEEDANVKDVIKVLKARLANVYGYYGVSITQDGDNLIIKLPNASYTKVTNGSGTASYNNSVLSNVAQQGKLEILNTVYDGNSASYSEDSVVVSQDNLRSATTRNYVNGEYTYYICTAKLTSEGNDLVKKAKLSDGTMYWYAIDGQTVSAVAYQNGQFQFYGSSKDSSKLIKSIVNKGELGATLTQLEAEDVVNPTSWVFAVVMGVLVLASFVFYAVRYKTLGIAGILSQLIACVIFIYAIAYIHLAIFNIFAAIGVILAYACMTFFTVFTFERIRTRMTEKTFATAAYQGFRSTNIISLIAHGALLVLGIILWVIPTFVTNPLGTVLTYGAILSFVATFGLNRLFVKFVEPFNETSGKAFAKK